MTRGPKIIPATVEWTNTKDRLPEPDKMVLLTRAGKVYMGNTGKYSGKQFYLGIWRHRGWWRYPWYWAEYPRKPTRCYLRGWRPISEFEADHSGHRLYLVFGGDHVFVAGRYPHSKDWNTNDQYKPTHFMDFPLPRKLERKKAA